MQNVDNSGPVDKQINIGDNSGPIYLEKQSKFSRLFSKLNSEVISNDRYPQILEELQRYLTDKDSYGLEKKLIDGGFSEQEIIKASDRKEMYVKKQEKNILYVSAQRIYCELLAKIMIDFEVYIDPLINRGETKEVILKEISEKVINPMFSLLNENAADDEVLYFNAEEIYGMIYYLTGRCHLNWKNYDSISPSI